MWIMVKARFNSKHPHQNYIIKINILLNVRERKGEYINMLTQDVVKAIAEKTEGTQKEAKAYLDAFKAVIVEALERGEDVDLKGFLSFGHKEVEARTAKNPKTGEEVQVEAHRKVSVTLAKSLRKF
jgi:DNA-binding protein HU-beta